MNFYDRVSVWNWVFMGACVRLFPCVVVSLGVFVCVFFVCLTEFV